MATVFQFYTFIRAEEFCTLCNKKDKISFVDNGKIAPW